MKIVTLSYSDGKIIQEFDNINKITKNSTTCLYTNDKYILDNIVITMNIRQWDGSYIIQED